MKKISKRLFASILAIAMFATLSIGAFAGYNSATTSYKGYSCVCSLTVNTYSSSASLRCTGIPGEPAILEPNCALDGTAFTSNGLVAGRVAASGELSCSAQSSWNTVAAVRASCNYIFMNSTIRTVSATV